MQIYYQKKLVTLSHFAGRYHRYRMSITPKGSEWPSFRSRDEAERVIYQDWEELHEMAYLFAKKIGDVGLENPESLYMHYCHDNLDCEFCEYHPRHKPEYLANE